jgi:choline transport protein
MMFFPAAPHPTAEGMNWSVLIFGVVIVFSLAYYWVVGRHRYDGPVAYVAKTV